MWWLSAVGTLLLVTSLKGLPLDANPEAEVVPELLENATLATELIPPPIDESIGKRHGVVYLINLYAVINSSDIEDGEEKLTDDVIETMPGILEPLATVLLVVEADDEEDPVSLDDIAKDLQDEGFDVEKVMKDGETKVIKVDFGEDPEAKTENDLAAKPIVKNMETTANKVRRKRAPCLKCKLGNLLGGGGGGGYGGGGHGGGGYGGGGYPGGGGGCGGGCGGGGGGGQYPGGGGGNAVGVIPVVVVPVSGYPGGGGGGHHHGGGGGYPQGGGGGGGYPQGGGGGGGYYPGGGGGGHPHHGGGGGGQVCQVCQGQGGGGGGGGGGSWSQSSAQSSAQSSSGSW